MDLHEYAHKFHESKKATGRAAETLTSYHFAIDRFLAWCDAKGYTDDDLFGVTGAETLEEYQMHMAGLAMSPFTIHGAFRNLRALYNWIERRFNLADGAGNPFRYLTMPKTPDLLPKAISYAQCLIDRPLITPNYFPLVRLVLSSKSKEEDSFQKLSTQEEEKQ